MKKFFVFGMIGAMALSFNACTSDDEVANENIDQKEVKTRFALSLTNSVKTRMDANLAQVDEQFRGMKDIQLFPFSTAISQLPPSRTTPSLWLSSTSSSLRT